MEMDQSFFDCIDPFNDSLTSIPALCNSDQVADALVPLPESFNDHFFYYNNINLSEIFSTPWLAPSAINDSLTSIPALCNIDQVADALVPLPGSFNDHFFYYNNINLSEIFSAPSLVPSAIHDHELQHDFDYLDNIIDVVPLNTAINDPTLSITSCEASINDSGSNNMGYNNDVIIGEKGNNVNGNSKLGDMGLDELKRYFYMPIRKAAKEMNVGLTLLKKRCRELEIPRWPHRKMKSLKTLIHNVQELGKESNDERVRREVESLEEHKRLMEENPGVELTERTKKLRQVCFKANYKRRRFMQLQYSDSHKTSPY